MSNYECAWNKWKKKKKASQDREIEDITMNQMKIMQLKNIVIEMKSSGNRLNIWRGKEDRENSQGTGTQSNRSYLIWTTEKI